MNKPCISFSMDDAMEAWMHIREGMEVVVEYGDTFEGKDLHTWDAGERTLCRCRLCGGFVLWQESEFHSSQGDDSYYGNFFPVTGPEEAVAINRRWDGWEIEDCFPERYLVQDNSYAPHWAWGRKEEGEHGSKEDRTENLSGEEGRGTDTGTARGASGLVSPSGEQVGERLEPAGSGKSASDGRDAEHSLLPPD